MSWANPPLRLRRGPALGSQRLEQCLCLLQVGGVKPLGEPAVDRREQLTGFSALALTLPQAGQAHGGAQLPRLRLLAAGHFKGLLKMRLRLRLGSWRVLHQQRTLEPIYLGLV